MRSSRRRYPESMAEYPDAVAEREPTASLRRVKKLLSTRESAMSSMPSVAVRTVNLDCLDPQEMAHFYGGLLGWEPTLVEPDFVLMRDPQGGTGLSFQQTAGYVRPMWPEEVGRQQKMIHLDLLVT